MCFVVGYTTPKNQALFIVTVSPPEPALLTLLLIVLGLVISGLTADYALSWPVGTLALWPCMVAIGATVTFGLLELGRLRVR